jgi:CDP-glucose 4,6-dehydratase
MAERYFMTPSFWKDKRVLLTGHTGFKGTWAATLLAGCGAKVTGMALSPVTDPSLWLLVKDRVKIDGKIADLRDASTTTAICQSAQPQIVLHLAAQALVQKGYEDPIGTFSSNVMGCVNLLEAARSISAVKTVLVVTSDKVYSNSEDGRAFDERSALGDSDPYSASKAAVELVASSYAQSYFAPQGISLGTARAGNVIGGGDFSSHRLVPDLYRAARAGRTAELRYPNAHRPWQHVLDCLSGYLTYIEYLSSRKTEGPVALNFGPSPDTTMTVAQLADAIGRRFGKDQIWRQAVGEFPLEKRSLSLDSGLARKLLGWRPHLDLPETIDWTAQWYAGYLNGGDAFELMQAQISRFLGGKSRQQP